MRVLVTGSSGFVGAALVRSLARAGFSGYAVSRKAIPDLPERWVWMDREILLGGRSNHLPSPPDWVVHLEVKHHVTDPGPADLDEFERVNCAGTKLWLEWCSAKGVKRFVYFSSIKAVGDAPYIQDESTQLLPSTAYGRSKRGGEECVRQWAREDGERAGLILRPAVIYGPGSKSNIASMIRAIDRSYFFLVGRNGNVKSLVSIATVISAVEYLIRRAPPGVAVYNLADRESYEVREIAAMIRRQLGKTGAARSLPLAIAHLGALAGEGLRRVTGRSLPLTCPRLKALTETTHFSCQKLMDTGFVHPQSTEEGLRAMVDWYHRIKT